MTTWNILANRKTIPEFQFWDMLDIEVLQAYRNLEFHIYVMMSWLNYEFGTLRWFSELYKLESINLQLSVEIENSKSHTPVDKKILSEKIDSMFEFLHVIDVICPSLCPSGIFDSSLAAYSYENIISQNNMIREISFNIFI